VGVGLVLAAIAVSATNNACKITLLGVASLSGMVLALVGSKELSANEFRAWCLFNAAVVGGFVYANKNAQQ